MLNEINEKLILDVKSDKVQVRQKAFNRLYEILNNSVSDLNNLINDDEDFSRKRLFKSVFTGISLHSQKLLNANVEAHENDVKINSYARVILKVCESPADESSAIPYDFLVTRICDAMRDDATFLYFGKCYLEILQKYVLKPKNNLTTIKLKSWIDVLDVLFLLLKSSRHNIPFADIVSCTKLTVELGCSYSHLSTELKQYLPILKSLLEKERRTKQEKQDLLVLVYHCCRNIAIDYRFEVCRFTETIAKYIHEVFHVDLPEETKESLFRLMDLSIVVHYPNLMINRTELEFIQDTNVWNMQLRNFWHIVNEESKPMKIKYHHAKHEVNQVFAQFAARLCYLIHWDDTIWIDVDSEEANASKRVKRSTKLQSLIDLAQPGSEKSEFQWKWLMIICELIYNYPSALENEDFQQILQMLSHCQPFIEHVSHVYAFTKCCFVLLQRDENFSSTANNIVVNLCQDLWHKIADGAARVCTSNNKLSIENHILLQILIHHQKYPSSSFIEDVIKLFLTQSTIKCDATLQTLVTVMKMFNLDSLPNEKELPQKILSYTFEKLSFIDLKKVITTAGSEKPTARVLSILGVICCLSKTDVVNYVKGETLNGDIIFETNYKLQKQIDYKKEIAETTHYLLLKANERLIIDDDDFLKTHINQKSDKKRNEYPIEIKCILDQTMLEQLQKVTEFKSKIVDEDNDIDQIREYLQSVMENNEIMMNLGDYFLYFEAFNKEKFESSFIAKKIDFHMQEIERLFTLINQKDSGLDMKETYHLLTLVKSLFSSVYHRKICLRLRTYKLDNCIKWVSKQVNHAFRTIDDDDEKMRIGLDEFLNAKMEERLKCLALETFLGYNNFEGVNTDLVVQRLMNINLDYNDNMDMHTVFHLLKLLSNQEVVPLDVTEWIWSFIEKICRDYHTHQYISSRMIESFQDIISISKNYPAMTTDVVQLYLSFGTICARPEYNSMVTVKFIQQFKYFHQEYFPRIIDEDEVKAIYLFIIEHFLSSNLFVIKMAAIKTIGYILHSNIEQDQEASSLKRARQSRSNILKNILNTQKIQYSGADMETDTENDDDEVNDIACHLQLFSTIFCVNFTMRKPMILEISKMVLRYNLSESTTMKIFNKILDFLKCDAKSLMDANSLIHLLSQWINIGLKVDRLPWCFAGSKSQEKFFEENYELIFLALLKNRSSQVDLFATFVELHPKNVVLELLPECFSFMLPIEAGCKVKDSVERNAEQMKKKLDILFTAHEQKSVMLRKTSFVIGHTLGNVYDSDKFEEICGFPMEIYSSNEIIDCASFEKCLNELKKHFTIPSDQSILTFFCSQRLYFHFIEKLLMMQKKKVQSTVLKEHKMLYLFQYCVLVEKLFKYLGDSSIAPNDSIKGFIVREVTNFLCFLLLDENYGMRLRETASNFLSIFLKKILPKCADDVKPFLNKILSSLVTICKNLKDSEMSTFQSKCFSIIRFLVFEQQNALEDEIAKLDKFPDDIRFKELQEKQLKIKYKKGNFSLAQEIEHFLSVKKRKIEGLIALRKHLAEKKIELKSLFEELSSTLGFSEDGEKSLLHKLIRSLVGYASNILQDEDRAVEAVKCLGEIGNYNLFTMVFTTEKHQSETVYEKIDSLTQCQKMICTAALDQMETMVLHENPRIFEAASAACYSMLETASSEDYKPSFYLRPFHTNTISQRSLFYEQPKEGKSLDLVKIIKDDEYSSYKTWIKRIAGTMILFAGNKSLEKVSSAQQSFAELMSPLMLQLLLCYNDETVNESIISGINYFFDESCEKLNYPKVNEGSIYLNKLAIRQMLKLVECIRIHCLEWPKVKMSQKIQELNYLNVAKSAKYCEAFFTAVLYCEMWAEKRFKTESLTFATSINHKTLQEIMYDSFTAIGIRDAFDLFVSPLTKRSLYLQITDQNWQNILEHDATFSESQTDNFIKLLNDVGLHYLTNKLSTKDQKIKSHQYECLWRLSKWDVLIESDSETKDQKAIVDFREEFEKYHYTGLKCLNSGDELGVKIALLKGRKSILQLLKEESLECTKNLYKFLGMAHLLQQIEDFVDVRFNRLQDSHISLLDKWKVQDRLPAHDFKLIEPILSQRNNIFDTANIKSGKRTWIPEALQSNMLHIVKESIAAECDNDAIKTIAKMRTLSNLMPSIKAEMFIKEAQLNLKNNMKLAKHCLKRVLDEKEFETEFMFKSIAYRLFGEIQAENHADEIRKLRAEYFDKSIVYLEQYAKRYNKSHLVVAVDKSQPLQDFSQPMETDDADVVDQKIKENICVFDIVAKYFDREYISLSEYIISPEFQDKLKTIENNEKKKLAFEKMRSKNKTDKDASKSCIILTRSLEIDRKEVDAVQQQVKVAAKSAVLYYLRGAINDPSDNVLSIFRIISIWMANLKSPLIQEMLSLNIEKIPSYKFLVALPQITVRLNDNDNDKSNKLLKDLVARCAVQHPHHTLPLILALVNSYADTPNDKNNQDEPRVIGAKKLWKTLKKVSTLPSTIKQMEQMSAALIDLANQKCDKMLSNHQVLSLKNLDHIQCPTLEIPIIKDGNYQNCVTSVVQWLPKFNLVGGINAPKKIYCLCSDGVIRPQLLKGSDDMRQDAVMQQVFGVVNQLLKNSKETSDRHARIRTYKVVPFSRRSGILEWCNNTMPIGQYLVGNPTKKGAHERYNPTDWKPSDCLTEVEKISNKTPEEKEKAFIKICSNIQPAFQHFFNENFKNPGMWFERRLAYTTCVAVSSIVGYILGIGDRHVQNILIDCNTAEVIHIDFGIAFEQGKILPHKELIPFRLTRDIVAPMGVCGVDGIFRKTCENTMEILRQNEKTLTTILEVLLYDPMYVWTLSTKQVQRRQFNEDFDDSSNEETNQDQRDSMASRALQRVQAKLKGQADDTRSYSSVEGQVECLIQKAMNTSLLSLLFKGWQAYL